MTKWQINLDRVKSNLEALSVKKTETRSTSNEKKEYLSKLSLKWKGNQGNYSGILIHSELRNKKGEMRPEFLCSIRNHWSLKCWNNELDNFQWLAVIPKHYYGDLNPEDSELYDEVLGKLKYMRTEEIVDWRSIRRKSWSFFYFIPLTYSMDKSIQLTANQSELDFEKIYGKLTLAMVPTYKFSDSISSSIQGLTDTAGGLTDWMQCIYVSKDTPIDEDRGTVTFSCVLDSEAKAYQNSWNHIIPSTFSKPVKAHLANIDLEKELSKQTHFIKDILGQAYDYVNDQPFNRDYFKRILDTAEYLINEFESSQATSTEPEPTEVKSMDSDLKGRLDPSI